MSDMEDSTAQLFAANSDLYDAEIDSGDENVNKDDGEKEDDFVIENGSGGDREERSDEDDPFPDNESDERDTNEIKIKKPKKIRGTIQLSKEPKKRKAKKDDIQKLHSETQRLIRESNVKLPYHQPETKDITHFLKRVPVNNNNKPLKNNKPTKHENIEDTLGQSEKEIQSSYSENLTTAEDKSPSETTAKPKLTAASDPFFFDDSCNKKPAGLNHLMERFFKHNKSNIKQTKSEELAKGQTEKADVVQVIDEVEKLTTTDITESAVKTQQMPPIFQPGGNLRSLKEKLQVNMKQKRAEVRKIHESQRKIDNEEISDEEEEEEFEDEEDSDFEVDEWNAEDERAQEERNEEAENGEEDVNKDTSDIQSNEESNSIADSETHHEKTGTTAQDRSKTQKPMYPDDQTMDLFPSDNSNQTANRTLDDEIEDNDRDSVDSEESIKLRLDSVDDSQDVFIDHHDNTSTRGFTKLKMPVNIYEQSSDCSNLPNAQPEKTGMNKMSEVSISNDGLTPFSRIQRFLGVDCSSVSSDKKSKPLSELTLPVEDSQDLYDEDDVIDKRFSNGLNTSKDFNFALDEDTQFTQFVDSQGYLLSTAKKKRKSNDQKSNDMSELLGLCSGTFSDQLKKKTSLETQQNMSELLGLCSGKFCDAASQNLATESQDNTNELLGLCSGKFPDDKKTKIETRSQNMSELLGLRSGKFGDENKSTSESQNMNELLDLCSGEFINETKARNTSETQNRSGRLELKSTFSFQSEAGKKDDENTGESLGLCSGGFSGVGSTKNSGTERSHESESGIFSELDQSEKRKPKSKQGLTAMFEAIADEENNMDEVVALCSGKFPGTLKSKEQTYELEDCKTSEKDEYEIEENSKNNFDVQEDSENEVFSDDEKQDTDDENMEEEDDVIKKSKKYGITYSKKVHSIFNKENFVEDEAELSGSEASSDEEDGSEDDELEEESDVEDLPSDEELQRQVNKVHLKSLIDEDKRELRELKERYLEDGDLYSEGGGRARNFRWQGLEDSQHDMFENKVLWGDDEIIDSALLSEAELERKKMKHERDQFLQEQLTRAVDTQPTDVDENSQNILNLINDTSNAGTDTKKDIPAMAAPTSKDSASTKLSQKRGSFLNRNKDQMTRLSSITATKKTPNTTRGFVFHTISPSSKTKEKTARKLQRSVSLSESPNPKRPRLDRTLSNIATGSLFAAMPV